MASGAEADADTSNRHNNKQTDISLIGCFFFGQAFLGLSGRDVPMRSDLSSTRRRRGATHCFVSLMPNLARKKCISCCLKYLAACYK
jgi:hypothetical protein